MKVSAFTVPNTEVGPKKKAADQMPKFQNEIPGTKTLMEEAEHVAISDVCACTSGSSTPRLCGNQKVQKVDLTVLP